MSNVQEYYNNFAKEHIRKHKQNNTLHEISRPWVEYTLRISIFEELELSTANKDCWIENIISPGMHDSMWDNVRDELGLSFYQILPYRPHHSLQGIEPPSQDDALSFPPRVPMKNGDSPSRAVSVSSRDESEEDSDAHNTNDHDEAVAPGNLSPLHGTGHDLSVIPEEESPEYESDSEVDSDAAGYNLIDPEGYTYMKGAEGYEAAKKRKVEAKALQKAGKMARKAARITGQFVQEHEEMIQPPSFGSAHGAEPVEEQGSDAEPTVPAAKKGKKSPAKQLGRSAVAKGKKPAPKVPPSKVRARAGSRSRANTPIEIPSRAPTPNVQTRSRANTPDEQGLFGANLAEASRPRKRKVDSLFGDTDSEPEELVQHREEPAPKKAKKNEADRPTTGGKGLAMSSDGKGKNGTGRGTKGGKVPAMGNDGKEKNGPERRTKGGKGLGTSGGKKEEKGPDRPTTGRKGTGASGGKKKKT